MTGAEVTIVATAAASIIGTLAATWWKAKAREMDEEQQHRKDLRIEVNALHAEMKVMRNEMATLLHENSALKAEVAFYKNRVEQLTSEATKREARMLTLEMQALRVPELDALVKSLQGTLSHMVGKRSTDLVVGKGDDNV